MRCLASELYIAATDFVPNTTFHELPSTGSRADTYGQTDVRSNISQ